ncbi:MAG TPA: ATP-binding protein [Conexibacter sp.]|jgi:signal transduction histidine kinase
MAIATLTLDELRSVDLFEGLSDEELQPWLDAAQLRMVADGTVVAEAGTSSTGLHLLLDGKISVMTVTEDDRVEPEGINVAPTWVGAIPSLTGGFHMVRMIAAGQIRLATIPRETFVDLLVATRPVFERVMSQMRPVIGRLTSREANRDRLAALGTMAAGLAHELNNPAAAAKRASSDMAITLDLYERMVAKLVEEGVERAEAALIFRLKDQLLARGREQETLSALESADREDAISDLLEELGVAEPWRWAEPLAAAGADEAWVRSAAEIAGQAIDPVISWVAASLQAHTLAAELAESTDRMSGLVRAVKSYAYMDRGGVVQTDIHEGLETTITVLGHKLKHTRIQVVRRYDKALPRITVHGSELNQVWTNLLDNAIDAVGETGTITIATYRKTDCVVVTVTDDGPGIPDEVRPRIFDPFFTTKEVGSGTGLGLDVARRIVVGRHGGSLSVDSRPGETTFEVWLPIEQRRSAATPAP